MKRFILVVGMLGGLATAAAADQCDNIASCIDNAAGTVANYQTLKGTGSAPGLQNFTNGLIFNDAPPWMHEFCDGSEADPGPNSFSVQGTHCYSSLTINAGQTITITDTATAGSDMPHGGLLAYVQGACTIAGTIAANGIRATTATGGNQGGAGGGGGGGKTAGAGVAGVAVSWFSGASNITIAAGGAAGAAAGGTGGNGGASTTATQKTLQHIFPLAMAWGGSNGGAGNAGDGTAGTGGLGGGGVVLTCGSLNFTGAINAQGANGGAPSGGTTNFPGSGGGAGGGVVITATRTVTANSGTINVAGGTGAAAVSLGGAGGNGGAGWSKQYTLN